MEIPHSFMLCFCLAWTLFSTFASANLEFGDGLNRRATKTTTSSGASSTGCCSTYGICSYSSPNADVVVKKSTCASCNTSCSTNSKCQFAYFAPSTSDCYIWYSAFNQAEVVDCFNLGTGPYMRVGVGCSSSSSSSTLSSTTSSTTKTSSTSSTTSSTTKTSSTSTTSTSSTTSKSSTTTTSSSSSTTTTSSSSSTTTTSSSSSSSSSSTTTSSSSSSSSSSTTTTSSSSSSSSSSSTTSSTSSSTSAAPSGTYTIAATILVLSTDETSSYSATSGLNAHGIPYQLVIIPAALPALNSSATHGNFGGIIILSEPTGITTAQWQAMYSYQSSFGVRMARLDADPNGGADGSSFGTSGLNSDAGCCSGTGEQLVYFSNTSAFPQAGIIPFATRSTVDIWHTPASITNASIAVQIAGFGPSSNGKFKTNSTAAVINTFGNREQMVWFMEFATDWALTSNFVMHAHINWITRSLYVGQRRILFNTQIDDLFLETDLYSPSGTQFRIRNSDLDAHVTWQANLNTRLPPGSFYQMELAFNGNGNVEWASLNDTKGLCTPENWIQYTGTNYVPADLEFQKPLGTGISIWPTTPTSFGWSNNCLQLDELLQWFIQPKNMAAFSHISHTFTHENEDNVTYSDVIKEIQWNQAWLAAVGISTSPNFSPQGLIPPAITGLHNGDALQAWWDSGLRYAVGDTSRPALYNPTSEYWPYITSTTTDGFNGMVVTPRWTMPVFYDCDKMACNIVEWDQTAGGDGAQADLLSFLRETWTSALLSLHQYPFMLHQANLRYGDTQQTTIGPVSGFLSLAQIFTETVIQELYRLTTWPIITKIHDVVGAAHVNRMLQDQCLPQLTYVVTNNKIVSASVKAGAGSCSVPIPVTFPVAATASTSYTSEQIGSDPLTLWTTVGSGTATFSLSQPISL